MRKKCFYSFGTLCKQKPSLELEDGSGTIFLSTCGEDIEGASPQLVNFLRFLREEKLEPDRKDEFVSKLQEAVHKVKESREMGERFMIFKEMLQEEREEGRIEKTREHLLMVLDRIGDCPDTLRRQITQENDLNRLDQYFYLALQANSVEEFIQSIEKEN